MTNPNYRRLLRPALLLTILVTLSACNAVGRVSQIGTTPPLAPIENPTTRPDYRLVSLPMPAPTTTTHMPNSLWRQGARAFFKDQRASRVGDILTVIIGIDDKAKFNNTTTRSRTNSDDSDMTNLFGLESQLARVFPQAINPASIVSLGSSNSSKGVGTVDRKEVLSLTIAVIVTQVLPNGNLVIQGRQEVRVNFEVRELLIAGVVRPEDISAANTVNHTQIAEARISYGGRGQLTDVQQPRYGQQVLDILLPF
ncbi:MAG: flagellar basal body L-ring protein FlgH [Proteobacteria bacterium]|nr:flagellar basal body L-ring protein FlgH [Pseudomonadota bacterium]